MRNKHPRIFQLAILFLLFILIAGILAALTKVDVRQLGAGAALNSPLAVTPLADQPIPVPREYGQTRIPVEQRAGMQIQWQTYVIPGEGLTFRARRDSAIASGKNYAMKYTAVSIIPRYIAGGMGFMQFDNPQGLSLEAFAKAPASARSSSGYDAKWLGADVRQYARDVSNAQYKRLLILRDDSKEDVTASINGDSKFIVLIAYDRRVLIAHSDPAMTPEGEQYFWEVLDSIQFTPITQ